MRIALMLMTATLAAPALGQDELPTLSEAMSAVDGREVTASGILGKRPNAGSYLIVGAGDPYQVRFALDREDLTSIDQCVFGYGWQGGCAAEVSAQIETYGSAVRLLVFEISGLQPAQPAE